MKNAVKFFIGILAISALAISSCKKKKDESARAKLMGKWKVTQQGIDANNNGVMDPMELITIPDSLPLFITFKDDENGTMATEIRGTALGLDFTWALLNNDQDINVKIDAPSFLANLVPIPEGLIHIQNLTFSDLTIKSTVTTDSMSVTGWGILKKQ